MEIVKTNSQLSSEQSVPVTVENFTRAESDLYFNAIVQKGGFGRVEHNRAAVPLDEQDVIRLNRDTLYPAAVRDLDAGPATITPPDAGKRFMSLQLINEDQYTPMVFYGKGVYTVTKGEIGTRYVLAGIRTLADPENPQDLRDVHALKDAIRLTQENSGNLETPKWDPVCQKKVREALLVLAEGLPDTKNMFGSKDQVDPVRFLIGLGFGLGRQS